MKQRIFQSLFAIVALPIQDPSQWMHLDFKAVPQNEIVHHVTKLTIKVNSSSSPLVHHLKNPVLLKAITVKGSTDGLPSLAKNEKEGWKDIDDYVLRVGLVTEGEKQFSWFERLFVPSWLTQLLSKIKGGFGQIKFLVTSQRLAPGACTYHPNYDYVEQCVVGQIKHPGAIRMDYALAPALKVTGVWIQSDGDETASTYNVTINKISLKVD